MAPEVAVQEAPSQPTTRRIVNDFSIQVATVNGSGSQTANLVLLRSIFRMGIPVSGKNLFPSNIAGLPTWYTIRANRDGYIARKQEIDFLVAMNAQTAQEDVVSLGPGAAVVYDEPLNLATLRDDLTFYPVPFDKLVAGVCRDAKLRRLVRNMIYDGVLASLLEIDRAEMERALEKQLGRKPKAVALNREALDVGFAYAEQHFEKRDPYLVEPMDATAGQVLIDGNAAAAIGGDDGRSHRRHLVPDHAVVLVVRDPHRLSPAASHRQGHRQGNLRRGAGRGRDCRHRHGDRGRLGGRAQHDVHFRTGRLADERVRGARALCGGPGGHLRRAARGAVDGAPDPHGAG